MWERTPRGSRALGGPEFYSEQDFERGDLL